MLSAVLIVVATMKKSVATMGIVFPKISKYARGIAVTAIQHVNVINLSDFTFESQ